jgi:hypothetical protein
MPPSIIKSSSEEAEYIALCTMLVSLITMSPSHQMANAKFESVLNRLNCNKNMGTLDSTPVVLKRMERDGYVFKSVDRSNVDDEQINWIVGPRGKVEIGNKGIMGLVEEVYGNDAPDDLDKRLNKSLGIERRSAPDREEEDEASGNGDPGPSTQKQKRRKGRQVEDDD